MTLVGKSHLVRCWWILWSLHIWPNLLEVIDGMSGRTCLINTELVSIIPLTPPTTLTPPLDNPQATCYPKLPVPHLQHHPSKKFWQTLVGALCGPVDGSFPWPNSPSPRGSLSTYSAWALFALPTVNGPSPYTCFPKWTASGTHAATTGCST